VLRDLLVVNREHDLEVDPDGLSHRDVRRGYFASSRSTARRFFMILRAASIWFSNAGLYGVKQTTPAEFPMAVSVGLIMGGDVRTNVITCQLEVGSSKGIYICHNIHYAYSARTCLESHALGP